MFEIISIGDYHDRAVWQRLWEAYDPHERPEAGDYCWQRLHDAASGVKGVFIMQASTPIGFAHYILSESTLGPKPDCYIKDIYIALDYRKIGAASAILEWFKAQAQTQKWAKVTLLTRAENVAAQRLYDKLCERSGYVHYTVAKSGQW